MFNELKNLSGFNKTVTFFDVETTGLNIKEDKIIQFYSKSFLANEIDLPYTTSYDNNTVRELSYLINPQMKIENVILELTGLNKEDIKNAPVFNDVVDNIRNTLLKTEIIIGYNILNFDIPLMKEEFKRVSKPLNFKKSQHFLNTHMLFIDLQKVVSSEIKALVYSWCHENNIEPNIKLETVYKFMTEQFNNLSGSSNNNIQQFHNASFDVNATILVFNGLRSIYNVNLNDYTSTFYNIKGYELSLKDKNAILTRKGVYKNKTLSEITKTKNGKNWLLLMERQEQIKLNSELKDLCMI